MPALPVLACCRPLAAPSLSDGEATETARLFNAVCDLTDALVLSQPTVSHHLKKLTEAGLLRRHRMGTSACFTLDPDAAAQPAAVTDLK